MKPSYNGRAIPSDGQAIQYVGGKFIIPDRPIIPFIEGDRDGSGHLESFPARI